MVWLCQMQQVHGLIIFPLFSENILIITIRVQVLQRIIICGENVCDHIFQLSGWRRGIERPTRSLPAFRRHFRRMPEHRDLQRRRPHLLEAAPADQEAVELLRPQGLCPALQEEVRAQVDCCQSCCWERKVKLAAENGPKFLPGQALEQVTSCLFWFRLSCFKFGMEKFKV